MNLLAWWKSHFQNIVINDVIYEKICVLFDTSVRNGLVCPQNLFVLIVFYSYVFYSVVNSHGFVFAVS